MPRTSGLTVLGSRVRYGDGEMPPHSLRSHLPLSWHSVILPWFTQTRTIHALQREAEEMKQKLAAQDDRCKGLKQQLASCKRGQSHAVSGGPSSGVPVASRASSERGSREREGELQVSTAAGTNALACQNPDTRLTRAGPPLWSLQAAIRKLEGHVQDLRAREKRGREINGQLRRRVQNDEDRIRGLVQELEQAQSTVQRHEVRVLRRSP